MPAHTRAHSRSRIPAAETRPSRAGRVAIVDLQTRRAGAGAFSSTFTPVTLDELREAVARGAVDTVLLAMTDMQGRLQGKRLTATHFLDEVVAHGAESCNYLLAVDVDMRTVDGYEMSSWERGYSDMLLVPDLGTLRPVPWQEGTAVCLADVAWLDGSEVVASPRQILRRQLARLAERGWTANAGTELEFLVFLDTYEEAWHKGYRDLRPANLYNVDYSLLGTARVEPLIRRIRNSMGAAGMIVEDSKGECNFGQHEINFRYADALRTADEHAIYKNGAKEIAADEGMALSFIAKFDEREGSSCHIHFSLADGKGPLFERDEALFRSFLAGQLECLREMTLLLGPNINSYKRYAAESFAPTAVAWGHDNRTCSLRVVGHGPSRRFENRVGGADLNPYLALSAIIASGLHGVDAGLELEPTLEGNAYSDRERPRVPATLRDARELFAGSRVAREAFGEEVVAHYLNAADVELAAFQAAVTNWELVRGFERL
jgi:glutamine synthetase